MPGCGGVTPALEGCVDRVCVDEADTCMGFILPFTYTAVPATEAGIPGLDCP